MYDCTSLTLPSVTYTIQCLYTSQLEWSINLSALVTGANMELILSALLTVESRKSKNFGVFPRTGLLMKFILFITSTSATSTETAFRHTTWLNNFAESLFLAGCPLMRALIGSTLLSHFTILPGCFGLTIYWSLNCTGETEIATNFEIWKLNLDLILEEEGSLGVALSISVPITFPVVGQMSSQGCAASVTFLCRRTVWCRLKLSPSPSTPAVTSKSISPTDTWMVRLFNNFCVDVLLVVSVSEILMVLWVAKLGSLFGLLPSTPNFSESLIASTCSVESFLNHFL